MHSAQIYDEVETLLGEDGPSTQAFLNLTYAQRIAVLMLSRGAKHTDVAIELDRSVRTLQYWMVSPTFRQALHEANRALLKEASASLHSKLSKAIDRLERIAQDPGEPASARVAANKALITLALRMDNTVERDEQIQFLREEQQQVLAALAAQPPAQPEPPTHPENSVHTCKNTKKEEILSPHATPHNHQSSLYNLPFANPPSPSPDVAFIPYATASADRANPAATSRPPASQPGFLPSFESLKPLESPPLCKPQGEPTTEGAG